MQNEMHMIKCNMQAKEMATTANNWWTPGASNPGRYNTPPLTRDLVPRSRTRKTLGTQNGQQMELGEPGRMQVLKHDDAMHMMT